MSDLVYFNIRLIIAGMLLVVGAFLFWGILPTKLRSCLFDSFFKRNYHPFTMANNK